MKNYVLNCRKKIKKAYQTLSEKKLKIRTFYLFLSIFLKFICCLIGNNFSILFHQALSLDPAP